MEFSKFGSEILKTAIEEKNDYIIQSIFSKIFQYITLIPFMIRKLPSLCDMDNYAHLVTKYFFYTSILLDPSFCSVKNSENNSLYAYSKNFHIKKSNKNYCFNYFKNSLQFFKDNFKMQQKFPKISFIVPFPQICKYQDNDSFNSWNEILYKPKSILFCNMDLNPIYKWWNFAAIIDFKRNDFGRYYYLWIWFFYTIFLVCFALASTLEVITDFYRNILFIISILFGLMHLYFEI